LTKNQKQVFDKYLRKNFGNKKLLANTFAKKTFGRFLQKTFENQNFLKQKMTKN
jgi:hypothetical protein